MHVVYVSPLHVLRGCLQTYSVLWSNFDTLHCFFHVGTRLQSSYNVLKLISSLCFRFRSRLCVRFGVQFLDFEKETRHTQHRAWMLFVSACTSVVGKVLGMWGCKAFQNLWSSLFLNFPILEVLHCFQSILDVWKVIWVHFGREKKRVMPCGAFGHQCKSWFKERAFRGSEHLNYVTLVCTAPGSRLRMHHRFTWYVLQ